MFLNVSFMLLGVLAILLAIFLVTRRSPVAAAMLLIADFVVLAAMYGLLDAHFAAAAQIIVYAGAIMVVFVFVMMILNVPTEQLRFGSITWFEWVLVFLGLFSAFIFGNSVIFEWMNNAINKAIVLVPAQQLPFDDSENVRNVAIFMFTDYLWAFELAGFLILAAMIGAVVASKKRSDA